MKHLLKYLSAYKKECILAPAFKMLEASFELFVPLVVASMIDKGMAQADRAYIFKCSLLLVFLAVVGLISAVTAQYFSAKAAVGFSTGLRKDLFSHLLSLSYNEYDNMGSSTMITRMTSDVMQCQTGINWFLRLMLRSPFVVFGAMIMAFTIDFRAAMVFVGVIAVLFVVVFVIMKSNIPLLEKAQGRLDNLLLNTRENLTGIRVLRAFSLESSEKENYRNSLDELYGSQLIAAKISSLMNPMTYIVINTAVIILIYVGAIRVDMGNLSQGSVVALYNYMSQILVELIKLANMIVTTNKALASGNRIWKVFEMTNSQEELTNSQERLGNGQVLNTLENLDNDEIVVDFDHVYFKYHENGDEALSDISFSVKKGETVGIIGGTGAGKSTLVSLIPRFYDASSGEVKVFGHNTKEMNPSWFRDRIGFVFQKASLFSGSIAENLRFGNREATYEQMEEAMELAVAKEVVEVKGGLDASVGEAGKELSGGQRQRVTIARALVKKPEILILDDSTSALDFATGARLIDNIKNLDYSPTVFIVSQRTNAMTRADKIIVLEDGCVVGIGTHDDLLESCDIYREIHNTQFGETVEKGGSH